jgi:Protein of unknown function (DUF2384)
MPTIRDPQLAEYLSLVKNLGPHEQELVMDKLSQLNKEQKLVMDKLSQLNNNERKMNEPTHDIELRQLNSTEQALALELMQLNDEQDLVLDKLRQLNNISDAHGPSEEDVLVEALADRTFSYEEQVKLELDALFQYLQWRRQLLKDALTSSQVAQLLKTSRQTPRDRVKARTLLGISDNGVLRFPSWQFDPEGPDGVIEGLPDVLKMLQVSDLAKLSWLVRPNPFLDGLTPLQALKQGQKVRVVQEAMGVGVS